MRLAHIPWCSRTRYNARILKRCGDGRRCDAARAAIAATHWGSQTHAATAPIDPQRQVRCNLCSKQSLQKKRQQAIW